MSSERIQRRIERLLGQAKAAAERSDWEESRRLTDDILALDPENADVQAYIVSELQLKIESLLIQAQAAAERSDWEESLQSAELVLAMDPDNAIAQSYVLRAGQGTIEHLLDQMEEAADRRDWDQVRLFAGDILALDPDNADAQTYNAAADRVLDNISDKSQRGHYEIVVDSFTGFATVRGDKVDFLPIDQRTRYQRQEFAVLEALYRNRGRALSLQQIVDECSSVFYFDSPDRAKDTIETCIISLRVRIEEDSSNPKIIRDVGDRSATSSGWPDKYMITPLFVQTATVSDTEDNSLPELLEETSQEVDQVTSAGHYEKEWTGEVLATNEESKRSTTASFAILYQRGVDFLENDQFEEAQDAFRSAITLRPEVPETWFLRAVASEGTGRYDQALSDCNQALTLRPLSYIYLWVRARLFLCLGRYEESLTDADQALELQPGEFDPNTLDQFYNFAATAAMIIVDDLRRWALEFLKRAIDCDPVKYRGLASQEQDFYLLGEDPEYGTRFRELIASPQVRPEDEPTPDNTADPILD